ncbi:MULTISPECIES: hypothetical protein [unclassified Streptomyces]|uniref:hypothetical protein n=1 Tax=unclassified Streptomyces TaxID=2593676 RepID=UPI002E1497BF|nr:hypothetical protein OG457_10280 [Streptomyces sp. NBC_01207]
MASPPPPPCSAGKGETPTPAIGATLTAPRRTSDPRSLLSADDFTTVTATLARQHPELGWVAAEQRVVEALKFVATVAHSAAADLAPSGPVDAGWHALISCTVVYAELCARLGTVVHHHPEVTGAATPAPGWLDRTTAAIEAAGYDIATDLW